MSEKTWLCVVCGTWCGDPQARVLTDDGPMHVLCDTLTGEGLMSALVAAYEDRVTELERLVSAYRSAVQEWGDELDRLYHAQVAASLRVERDTAG